jgi:hypothetical protein
MSAPNVPATVASLAPNMVSEALARHACNVSDAARDLGVPPSDLRRLLWANPQLQDAAFEVVEGRLDLAEKNIAESLRSGNGRERLAASFFTIRNSHRARKRGWITSSTSAAELSISTEAAQLQTITFCWQNSDGSKYEPATESFERDGRTFTVPKYGGGRGDPIEGEVATPAVLIEHAATVAPEPEPAAPSPMEALSVVPEPESAAVRREREQVDAWIRNRLIAYPLASCLRCRKPFVAGAAWEEVSNGGARARFHRACHAEWRAEREAAARQALGLEG